MKAITYDIKGIKCDNRECGWKDMSVQFDMDKYLNAPCPKCGSNLFTQADYDTMKRMFRISDIINVLCYPFIILRGKKEKTVRINIKMNGSGKPDLEVK